MSDETSPRRKRFRLAPFGHPIAAAVPEETEDEPSGVVIPVYAPPDTIPPPLPKRGKVFREPARFLEAKQAALEETIAREVARALVPLTKDVEHVRADVAEFKAARRTRGERIWDAAKILIAIVATYLFARR